MKPRTYASYANKRAAQGQMVARQMQNGTGKYQSGKGWA